MIRQPYTVRAGVRCLACLVKIPRGEQAVQVSGWTGSYHAAYLDAALPKAPARALTLEEYRRLAAEGREPRTVDHVPGRPRSQA